MAKYHVNPTTGEAGKCRARHNCPYGGENEHYSTAADARKAFEKYMDGKEQGAWSEIWSHGIAAPPVDSQGKEWGINDRGITAGGEPFKVMALERGKNGPRLRVDFFRDFFGGEGTVDAASAQRVEG